MLITSILGNSQRLDGGAMFGNVPKAMWEKWVDVDDNNQIALSCRALLIQIDNKNILLETGIGAFFEPKLKERFGVIEKEHVLLKSLEKVGLKDSDIDIIILSHLHFDHAGGLLAEYQEGSSLKLLFPNAKFVVGSEAFERASCPHPRDKASFISELPDLLKKSNRLVLIGDKKSKDNTSINRNDNLINIETINPEVLTTDILPGFRFHLTYGHTPGMILTEFKTNNGPIIFGADLIPGTPWVHLPVTMGYDRYPERLIDEKKYLLNYLKKENGMLFYTHDNKYAISKIKKDEKGKFVAIEPQAHLLKFNC